MRMTDQEGLEREHAVFSAYLGSYSSDARVVARYSTAHAPMLASDDRFDRWLVAFARRGRVACSLADAYARRVRPYGLLRRKLTLVLALLETGSATHAHFDRARPASRIATLSALAGAGVWWVLRTALALIVVAPLHLAAIVAPGGRDG